jgi:uncharacterized protein YabN with tetrapyrrole methylase and pyrophosphatase domain
MPGSLTIVGVGSDASEKTMTVEAWNCIKDFAARARRDRRIRFYSTDTAMLQEKPLFKSIRIHELVHFYRTSLPRQSFYRLIAKLMIERAFEHQLTVVYFSAGNPYVYDHPVKNMRILAAEAGHSIRTVASMSFLDSVFAPVGGLDARGASLFLARSIVNGDMELDPRVPVLLSQLTDWSTSGRCIFEDQIQPRREFLRSLQDKLLKAYEPSHRVCLLQGSQDPLDFGEVLDQAIPISALCDQEVYVWSNLYIPPKTE